MRIEWWEGGKENCIVPPVTSARGGSQHNLHTVRKPSGEMQQQHSPTGLLSFQAAPRGTDARRNPLCALRLSDLTMHTEGDRGVPWNVVLWRGQRG